MEPFWTPKKIALGVVTLVVFVFGIVVFKGLTDYCELQEFHVWQGVTGTVRVIDEPGYYMSNFGKHWEYPKTLQKDWKGEHSIRTTFNDAGKGTVATFVQISLPTDKELRLKLQEKFGGNPDNILNAVHAHLTNCIKNSGPLMSATENQSSRKAEFTQVIEDQLRNGLYEMRRTRVELKDRVDEKGKPVVVEANEIVTDEKRVPTRQAHSPLTEYGLVINQFSVTETEYDDLTNQQFKAKQEAFLAAERSKAQREQEIQQKQYIIAQGERQVAEIEAQANQEKARAVTAAKQKVEVAMQEKEQAETVAAMKVAVALKDKEAAETRAQQEAQVAQIAAEQQRSVMVTQANGAKESAALQAEADKLRAAGIVAIAEAKQKEIQLGGAVKESDRVLAEIARDRDIKVAENLSRIAVPGSIYLSGGVPGTASANGTNTMGIDPFLFNLTLLRNSGLLEMNAKPRQAAADIEQPQRAADAKP